jgi:endonuclease/exonuclease/phosphatase family metal-dependent hydrolase
MPVMKQLRTVQLNAENLFLFFDKPLEKPIDSYLEKEWQNLSSSHIANKPLQKVKALAAALTEINADVILLNEVGGHESLQNFNQYFLNSDYVPLLIEGNSDRGIDCAYLVRKTLPYKTFLKSHKDRPLNFIYPHEHDLNEYYKDKNPERIIKTQYFSRDCLELRLFDPKNSQLVLVFLLVHLKSKLDPDGIDPMGRKRRAAEVKTLIEIYLDIQSETLGKVSICVAGDFNGISRKKDHEVEFKPIYEKTDLQDLFDLCDLDDNQRATQIQISKMGRSDLLQIDAIFVSKTLAKKIVKDGCTVHRYKNELRLPQPLPTTLEQRLHLPSDHYPVVATFRNL